MSHTATTGRNDSANASWNDDTSATTTFRSSLATASLRGRPMLPAAIDGMPDAASISATRLVTVVFPLVPVTATSGQIDQRDASSTSPRTGTPAAWARP